MTSGRSNRPVAFRIRSACLGLAGKVWALSVNLRKQIIAWQDRLGLYSYSGWVWRVEQSAIRKALAQPISNFSGGRVVCFVIAEETISIPALVRTLASLKVQGGIEWSLVLFLPAASPCLTSESLKALLTDEPQVRLIVIEDPVSIESWITASNELPGEWVVPLGAGDQLSQHWSSFFNRELALHPQTEIIYWDEDVQIRSGRRSQPFFKPDWSPELLFSLNYLESAAFCKKSLNSIQAAEGWIFAATQAARQISHVPFVLQHRSPEFRLANLARLARHAKSVRAFLSQRGAEEISVEPQAKALRVCWKTAQPLVSIIIPTKNNLVYLRRCLSTLFKKTVYGQYEVVLMDDRSTDPAVQAYYQELRAQVPNLRIVSNEPGPFNYSRVNNQGARLAHGELLLFLNNDVEILTADWLSELVRWAQEPGVGMVGAKLLYPNGMIQHAGIVVGMTGHANHVFAGKQPVQSEMFLSPDTLRNVSAVTGACMLVRREVFEQVGGFDEALSLVFNDVELCLRVLNSGWRVVYTPAARLIHYEGRSRARYIPPENILLGAQRLRESIMQGDPYYNPNLSYEVNWPTLRRATQPRRLWLLDNIVRYKG